MAHRDCPEGTACFIRAQAERIGVSVEKAIDLYSQESGIPRDTLQRWVYPRGKSQVKNDLIPKSTKKHTNPEVRSQLDLITAEFKAGNVTDADMKRVLDAGAEAISTGKANHTVADKIVTAHKKKKPKKKGGKKKSDVITIKDSLMKSISSLEKLLDALEDGQVKIKTDKDLAALSTIRKSALSMMRSYARMGINVKAIAETLVIQRQEVDHEEAKTKRLEGSTITIEP